MKVFFFSSRRRHTIFDCDWSSDVCSSDLGDDRTIEDAHAGMERGGEIPGTRQAGMAGAVCGVKNYAAVGAWRKKQCASSVGWRNSGGAGGARAVGSFALL